MSLRVHPNWINRVKRAVTAKGYPSQQSLAEDMNYALCTVNNFLNGKPVHFATFDELSDRLGFDWRKISLIQDKESFSSKLTDDEGAESNDNIIYVKRFPAERDCYQALLSPGAFVWIKGPNRFGKRQLLNYALRELEAYGYQTVTFSFEGESPDTFANLSIFLLRFCAGVGDEIGADVPIEENWKKETFSPLRNCTQYFEKCLLADRKEPLVLALCDVDRVFEQGAVRGEFCNLLRSWYNRSQLPTRQGEPWKPLRLIIMHSTDVYSRWNINNSPLQGVGKVIKLRDFELTEIQQLAGYYRLQLTDEQVGQLIAMIGGHPYMNQKVMQHLTRHSHLDELLKCLPTEEGPLASHLRLLLGQLQHYPELAKAYQAVVTAEEPVKLDSEQIFKLDSMGLIQKTGNDCMPRYEVYRQYFSVRLE